MTSKPARDDKSSYEKGINNLLQDIQKYEALIWAYVLRVNSRFHSKDFPSTQIAKIIVSKLNIEKTRYSFFHKAIRIILSKWTGEGLCERVQETASKSAKKTKEIFRFTEDGLEKLKAKFIDQSIDDILKNVDIERDFEVLKTRENIIEDIQHRFKDQV